MSVQFWLFLVNTAISTVQESLLPILVMHWYLTILYVWHVYWKLPHCKVAEAYTVFAQMDAAATIIFRSGKMWRLLEGSYHSRCYNSHIIVRILHSASVASQVDKAFCCAWSPLLQDSVDSAEGGRDGRPVVSCI